MKQQIHSKTVILFSVLFLVLVSTPAVIIAIDDSVDVVNFDGLGEEEEVESFKLICEVFEGDDDIFLENVWRSSAAQQALKSYSKPYLNQVLPPPEA